MPSSLAVAVDTSSAVVDTPWALVFVVGIVLASAFAVEASFVVVDTSAASVPAADTPWVVVDIAASVFDVTAMIDVEASVIAGNRRNPGFVLEELRV